MNCASVSKAAPRYAQDRAADPTMARFCRGGGDHAVPPRKGSVGRADPPCEHSGVAVPLPLAACPSGCRRFVDSRANRARGQCAGVGNGSCRADLARISARDRPDPRIARVGARAPLADLTSIRACTWRCRVPRPPAAHWSANAGDRELRSPSSGGRLGRRLPRPGSPYRRSRRPLSARHDRPPGATIAATTESLTARLDQLLHPLFSRCAPQGPPVGVNHRCRIGAVARRAAHLAFTLATTHPAVGLAGRAGA